MDFFFFRKLHKRSKGTLALFPWSGLEQTKQTRAVQWSKDGNTGRCIFVCRSLMKWHFVYVLPVHSSHICAFTKQPTRLLDFFLILDLLSSETANHWSLDLFCTPVTYYASKCVVETHLIFPKEFWEKDVSFFCCLAWQNLRNLWMSCPAAACIFDLYWPTSTCLTHPKLTGGPPAKPIRESFALLSYPTTGTMSFLKEGEAVDLLY